MKTILDNVTQAVGRTPLTRLNRIARGCECIVLAKLESQNPLGSVKDRIGAAMIETAESDYKGKSIQDSDLDSIINKTCRRMIDVVNTAQSQLAAIGGAGIKEPEQGLIYPGYLEE